MSGAVAIRALAVQGAAVLVTALVLGAALPTSFFERWGAVAGPLSWALCALVTAVVLSLPVLRTLVGAALAGIPAIVAVVAGVHWAGTLIALVVFAGWCGTVAAPDRSAPDRAPHGPSAPESGRRRGLRRRRAADV
ncbi:MAG: hypothetical protein ACR2NA_02255 [Solirubrobacterales bacterium]